MLGNFVAPLERGYGTQNARPSTTNTQASSSTHSSGSAVLAATAISLEYASLINAGHCPLGIYVLPSTATIFVWDAVFFVHQGRCALCSTCAMHCQP